MGVSLKIAGKDYDVEKDFTWEELMLVEQQSGVPLGRDGAFDSMAVLGAFVFVVLKRADEALTWEQFVKQTIDFSEPEEAETPRPTRAKAKTTG